MAEHVAEIRETMHTGRLLRLEQRERYGKITSRWLLGGQLLRMEIS
jgi:hypothetical protein